MEANITVYDNDVNELLDMLNKDARNFDKQKYGLPPHEGVNLRGLVYHWLHIKTEENKAKK